MQASGHNVIALFNLGTTEVLVILFVVLLLFGAKRLPELSRSIGKSMREFRKAASEVEEEVRSAMEEPPSKPHTPAKPAPDSASKA